MKNTVKELENQLRKLKQQHDLENPVTIDNEDNFNHFMESLTPELRSDLSNLFNQLDEHSDPKILSMIHEWFSLRG